MSIHMPARTHIYAHIYTDTHACTRVCTCVYPYVHTNADTHAYTNVCTYFYAYRRRPRDDAHEGGVREDGEGRGETEYRFETLPLDG